MINHGYEVKLTEDEVLNRNFNLIKLALDAVASAINYPSFISFVCLGVNGVGKVGLAPPKQANGNTPLYRAATGMRLVAAVDLTNLVSLQTSFEQTLSGNDGIKQTTATNLSAVKLLFLLQG